MSLDLQVLADHRDALLLAEVAAWLHMLGKFHEDFLGGKHRLAIQIPSDISTNFPRLHSLLTDPWPGAIWDRLPAPELGAASLSIYDLIREHHNHNAAAGLTRLMWDAHGRGSGTEKGVLERFAPGQQGTVYSATAFGHESEAIDLDDLQERRTAFYSDIEAWLEDLHEHSGSVDWAHFRQAFVERIEREFRTTVAESRRPINDVTLFDQTAASVAILKAALAQVILAGWKEPVQASVADKYKWRFLRIGINGPAFWGQASRVNDVLARRNVVDRVLAEVRNLLETEYPLAAEVYRDENGSLFIVPDIEDLLQVTLGAQTLSGRLEQIANVDFEGEAQLECQLSEATRNMLFLGRMATSELRAPSAKPEWLNAIWTESKPRDVCPVCGMRPQGPGKKALERKVCDVCEQRRLERSREWTTKQASTIWTDEIADETGRLALVVGAFSLEKWLSGEMLNSVLMFDPEKRTLTEPKRENPPYPFDYNQLLEDIRYALRRRQFTRRTLLARLVLKSRRGGGFNQFFDIQVIDSDLQLLAQTGKDHAELLALAMLRQNPSFARIRRVWETTRTFWREITEQIQTNEALIPLKERRFSIKPGNPASLDLGPYHAYELVVEGIRVSLIWDQPNGRFITADNLDYLATGEQLGKPLEQVLRVGGRYRLEEPSGYGGANRKLGSVTVAQVGKVDTAYAPIIPILAEPRTFMALVPANEAIKVARAIKDKYEREMGKVRNRLPLHLGVVYAGRRTPLRAVLDTGRRMLKQTAPAKGWRVAEVRKRSAHNADVPERFQQDAQGQFAQWYEIDLERDGRRFTWHVPAMMGDGQTEDLWYPYIFLDTETEPTDHQRRFQAPNPFDQDAQGAPQLGWLVHVGDLKQDDTIYFTPSTFDFEYLDASARRFEVAYGKDDGRRLGNDKKQRPYLLEEVDALENAWEALSQALTTSQIKKLEATIEEKRQAWGEPTGTDEISKTPSQDETRISQAFATFVEDTLANHGAPRSLKPAALTGMLADALEIHMSIHKEKTAKDTAQKETSHDRA